MTEYIQKPQTAIYAKEQIKKDDNICLADPNGKLDFWIQKLSELLQFLEVLFIIDDIIANKDLDKKRQPLLELAMQECRNRGHYLWLLAKSYKGIPKKLREQAKAIFVWYPQARIDLKMIHDENNVLKDDELVVARNFLKKPKHACLYIQNELPREFKSLNHI